MKSILLNIVPEETRMAVVEDGDLQFPRRDERLREVERIFGERPPEGFRQLLRRMDGRCSDRAAGARGF